MKLDKHNLKLSKKAAEMREKVKDRRRSVVTIPPLPSGEAAKPSRASKAGRTAFLSTVKDPGHPETQQLNVFSDGRNNAKLGGDVLVGRLKGARVYGVTLEERKTCPSSCAMWEACYGNNMPYARRWTYNADLLDRMEEELAVMTAGGALVLVRLHVLGDFPDLQYVLFWEQMLRMYPTLHAFGFTAHPVGSEINNEIARVGLDRPGRFVIRTSGITGPMGAATVDFPTNKKKIGDMLVCPEQRDSFDNQLKFRHCCNCAACWESEVGIIFVEH